MTPRHRAWSFPTSTIGGTPCFLNLTRATKPAIIASLQAALKNAIQVRYQLEDGELAVEPLPTRDKRRLILIYESAEGGAGVLRAARRGSRRLCAGSPEKRCGSAITIPTRVLIDARSAVLARTARRRATTA